MGWMGKLQGVRPPAEGVAPVPPEELRQRLLALNHPDLPFTLAPGDGGKKGDVVAEWRIVDAKWYEIFAKAGLKETHKILLSFDAGGGAVRVLEESWSVDWRAGVPEMSVNVEAFRGRTITSKSFGEAYAFKSINPLDYGEVYTYRFDVAEMKDPVAAVITGAGWTFRPVMSRRKLAAT